MIVLYIWARDLNEACEDVKHGFGYNSLLQAKANRVSDFRVMNNKPPVNFPKLFEVTINAKEIE